VLDSGDTDVTTYTWDYRNRLTAVDHYAAYCEQSDKAVQYSYDYANRLVSKLLDSDGAGGTADVEKTAYVYDGSQIALQFNKTSATGSASALSASDLSHRYLWGPAVDQLLADEHVSDLQTPGDVVWPLTDHLGTVRDLAVYDAQNDVTTIANHRVYDSYGNLTSQTNSAVDCVFGFTGRQFDKQTGLQNNLNRWYDAKVGRWASEDPIEFNAQDANLYRYVGNISLVSSDPSGLVITIVGPFEFRIRTTFDLFRIGLGKNGGDLIMNLHNSRHTIIIQSSTGRNYITVAKGYKPGSGSGSNVGFNPDLQTGGMDTTGCNQRPPFIGLAHELGHAEAVDNGTDPGAKGTDAEHELNALKRENDVRSEHFRGWDLRPFNPRPAY
jgi:RHS repeat-associated protein